MVPIKIRNRRNFAVIFIRARIEGGWPGVVSFFRRNFGKMCLFLHDFLALFWKIEPQKHVFWTIHEGYPEKFFMNPNFFPKLTFIAFFGHFFSKNRKNFLKRRLRRGKVCRFSISVKFPVRAGHPPLFEPWYEYKIKLAKEDKVCLAGLINFDIKEKDWSKNNQ